MATKKTTTTTTTRKRSSGSVTKYGILKGFSYFALVISAFIFLFGAIFGQVGAVLNLIGKSVWRSVSVFPHTIIAEARKRRGE